LKYVTMKENIRETHWGINIDNDFGVRFPNIKETLNRVKRQLENGKKISNYSSKRELITWIYRNSKDSITKTNNNYKREMVLVDTF
jgi:hypothetical protein